MGNGTTSQRSRSRDREQDYKQQQQSQQQMGNSWAAASGNPAGVGSGGDLRSSTDELRRRFFENGLGEYISLLFWILPGHEWQGGLSLIYLIFI